MELGYMLNGIRVVSVVELLQSVYGEAAFKWNGPSYQETSAKVREWVAEHNAHYYAEVKENFFVPTAIREARNNRKKIVLVDNLS